jgi:hypothetical protein
MKTTNKILSLACATALFASPAFADNNDQATVNVSGKVVASLTLGTPVDVVMPDVVTPDTGEMTTVDLSCDNAGAGTVTYDANGGNPFAHGTAAATAVDAASLNKTPGDETGTCGSVAVSGEPNFHYTLATTMTDTTSDVTDVTMTGASCRSASDDATGTGTLSSGGSDTVYCGAAVQLDGTTTPPPAGAYASLAFTVDVVYD